MTSNKEKALIPSEVMEIARKLGQEQKEYEEQVLSELSKRYGKESAIAIMRERQLICGGIFHPGKFVM